MNTNKAAITHFVRRYLANNTEIDSVTATLKSHITFRKVKKNSILIHEGQRHSYFYFIVEGSLRSFYLKDGTEVNTWFAFEHELVGSFQNYLEQPASETLQALTDCQLIVINTSQVKALAFIDQSISNLVRSMVEEYALYLEEKLRALQMSASERYDYLLQREPNVLLRVPLTYIASYLGISRETLSRIRAKR